MRFGARLRLHFGAGFFLFALLVRCAQIVELPLEFFRAHTGAFAQRAVGAGLGFGEPRCVGVAFFASPRFGDRGLVGALALFSGGKGQTLRLNDIERGLRRLFVGPCTLFAESCRLGFQSRPVFSRGAGAHFTLCAALRGQRRAGFGFDALDGLLDGMHRRGMGKIAVPARLWA